MPKVAIILINYKDYGKKYLSECLASIRNQDFSGESRLFIVDNETSEESFAFLKQTAPEAEIIRNKNNDGFAKGNNDAMKIALRENFDYLVLFNMDTVIEPDCVSELVEAARRDEKIGAVQARLMLWPEKDKINSLGNIIHFLGFGYCVGYNAEISNPPTLPTLPIGRQADGQAAGRRQAGGRQAVGQVSNSRFPILKNICYPSGAAVLFKAKILRKVGLFDEEFWMYNEDEDLGWRIWLSGYKCVLAYRAVVYHKYEFSRSIKKYYWMDRNRIIAIIKNYRLPTLFLLLPAFIIMEIGLLFSAWSGGWLQEKINVCRYFFKLSTWRYLLKARRASQRLRRVKDRGIAKMFSGRIWYQEIGDWKLKLVNPLFAFYWQLVKFLIFW